MAEIKCHVCKNDAIIESLDPFIYFCPTEKRRFEKIPGIEGHAGWKDPDMKSAKPYKAMKGPDESGTTSA